MTLYNTVSNSNNSVKQQLQQTNNIVKDNITEDSNDPMTNSSNHEIDYYDLGIIIKLVQSKNFNNQDSKQVEEVEDEIKKITKSINDEVFYPFNNTQYQNELRYLNSKININSKYDNNLAVSRDMLKISILENRKNFADTINSIIDGKNSFKDKKYFVTLLKEQIKRLKKIDIKPFEKEYNEVITQTDPITTAFKDSFITLKSQLKAHSIIYNYLKTNMNEYRPSNFILDDLSLKYVIKKIDSNKYIKHVSETLDYYFHISIGKIVILLIILFIFMIINKKILPFLTKLFNKKLSKKIKTLNISILDIIPDSFRITMSLIIYLFSIQVSLILLIEDANLINKLIPWFNTTYLALFSFMFYRILTNYINESSDKIFNQYPNMRKEMVDFILRIIKILILIFVLLFLLVQLGFDIKAIIASLGIGGIAVALAAKDTLSNFFGSLNIITDNSFSQGDWIKAGNVEGTVVDIRMRTTRIRTFDNGMITIPNAELANLAILNWSKRVIGRRIKMIINITYDSKMSDIQNLVVDIRDMLQNHSEIATSKLHIDKKPYLLKKEDLIGIKNNLLVYIDEYSSSSIDILVYCFSRSPNWEDWLETKQDVIVQISKLVEKNNCKFAFPTQTIYIEKE
ncbi:mechanosensitive ion channel family protein [Malaciobacter molluscorum]|uniref:mechanosensitive ion channel family protein n=1 Tax=Malaciobacter molluscorum TaxID=1032072 RepID=UPI00100B0021|nr:mechanosensitive ion channel family protein [Malaciobacter molluscorum]